MLCISMMTPQSLSNQSFVLVLIDAICSFIDEPRDLLSFALTSRQVCKLVIPHHIEYRHLRCDFRRIALWTKLSQLPAVASRFISLEIIVENRSDAVIAILPARSPILAGLDDPKGVLFDWSVDDGNLMHSSVLEGCRKMFVAALQCMPGLVRFHWAVEQLSPAHDILATFLGCNRLDDCQILSYHDHDIGVVNPVESPVCRWRVQTVDHWTYFIVALATI
jgi:hypothetical protein